MPPMPPPGSRGFIATTTTLMYTSLPPSIAWVRRLSRVAGAIVASQTRRAKRLHSSSAAWRTMRARIDAGFGPFRMASGSALASEAISVTVVPLTIGCVTGCGMPSTVPRMRPLRQVSWMLLRDARASDPASDFHRLSPGAIEFCVVISANSFVDRPRCLSASSAVSS
jgi:hypothetical protein